MTCLRVPVVLLTALCACSGGAGPGIPTAAAPGTPDAAATSSEDAASGAAGDAGTAVPHDVHRGLLVGDDESGIYTVRADGSGRTTLMGPGNYSPSWTPDGKIIFVSLGGDSAQVHLMSSDGKNPEQLGNLQLGKGVPIFRPQLARNGLIAFAVGGGSPTQTKDNPGPDNGTWIMQKDGSGLRKLIANCIPPSLALSGTWLTCTIQTEEPYHREIYRINTDGTGLQQLTFVGDDPDYPDANASAISPDETSVAIFSGKESDEGLAGFTQSPLTWGHRNVAVIPAAGGARKNLTSCKPVTTQAELAALAPTDCIAADNPTWSPDGKSILHDSDRGGTWIIGIDGKNGALLSTQKKGTGMWPLKFND